MSRLSLIQKNVNRTKLVQRYSKKREMLKSIIKNKKTTSEDRIDAINKLYIWSLIYMANCCLEAWIIY